MLAMDLMENGSLWMGLTRKGKDGKPLFQWNQRCASMRHLQNMPYIPHMTYAQQHKRLEASSLCLQATQGTSACSALSPKPRW